MGCVARIVAIGYREEYSANRTHGSLQLDTSISPLALAMPVSVRCAGYAAHTVKFYSCETGQIANSISSMVECLAIPKGLAVGDSISSCCFIRYNNHNKENK